MGFGSRLTSAVLTKKNPVCVGLDPRWQQLPGALRVDPRARGWQATADAYRTFCHSIIDVVAPLVPIVKPQSAFFEELGPAGVSVLEQVVRYANSKGLLVILDGKRNDIGSTATAYAKAYLGSDSPFGADSLTVSPYLGKDSLEPFVDRCIEADAGIFVLVKTSNPGSGFMQDLSLEGATISDRVADYVQEQAMKTADSPTGYGSVGCVVGATYPEQLIAMRQRMPNAWILIPGYGAQGGSAEDVRHGLDSRGLGAVVNSSRGIIFAHEKPQYASVSDWTQAVEAATLEMIEQLR